MDIKSDEFKPCCCGGEITEYGLAYGHTPYLLHCNGCGKDINDTAYLITGNNENLYDYWNNHMADKTKEELTKECHNFLQLNYHALKGMDSSFSELVMLPRHLQKRVSSRSSYGTVLIQNF